MLEVKPTDVLKEEHREIKLMLEILEKICQKLEEGEEVDAKHLESVLEFIRTFADKCHHGKEEDLLFPEFEKVGIPKEQGPIGVMLMEHDFGREFVKGFAEGIEEYKKGSEKAKEKIIENARKYIELLREHIDKEDNILYPMGEEHLTEEKRKELLENFEKVEREVVGEGVHEKMHEVLHILKKIYLGGSNEENR